MSEEQNFIHPALEQMIDPHNFNKSTQFRVKSKLN